MLRTVKRMGRILADDGRAVGMVPMDVWRDQVGGVAAGTPPGEAPAVLN